MRRATQAKEIDQLALLWNVLPHPSKKHVVRLFTRAEDERSGDYARNLTELKRFVKNNADKNIYVAPNPTCSTIGARHSAGDVTHWSYFLIDMDPIEKVYNAEKALDEALLHLGEWLGRDFKRRPPIIIDSGRGRQAWIRLEDVPLETEEERRIARRVNGYWLKRLDEKLGVIHGCRIDTSVSDLPRVMRCPGTTNMKTKRATFFVEAPTTIFTGIAALLKTGTPPSALSDPVVQVAPGQRWQKVTHLLTKMACDYLLFGQEEPGRHKVMWHTAKKLAELGVSRIEAGKALTRANMLKGEDAALEPEDIEHALKTAYGA